MSNPTREEVEAAMEHIPVYSGWAISRRHHATLQALCRMQGEAVRRLRECCAAIADSADDRDEEDAPENVRQSLLGIWHWAMASLNDTATVAALLPTEGESDDTIER